MLKKFLAGLTAIALSLGMVALAAAPASAHAGNITAAAVCNPATGAYDITYTLSWSNIPNGVTAPIHTRTGTTSFQNGWGFNTWNDWTNRGTTSGAAGSIQWTESLPGTTTGNGPWVYAYTPWSNNHNGATKHDTRIEGLDGDCGLPDDTSKKIYICHATGSNSNPYTRPEVSVSSIITLDPNGHGGHGDDIIPPFTYVKQGVNGSYPGQNWTTYGQWVYYNSPGCSNEVTPVAPTFTNAQCTGPGTYGQASYTIPSTTGVRYLVSINDGSYAEKSAGTYFVNVGTKVEVDAEELAGYELKGSDSQWEWSKTFSAPDCDADVTPTKPTIVEAVCTAEGQVGQASYTIPSIIGVKYQISTGNHNGPWVDIAAGVHYAADGSSVWIQAVELFGYDIVGTSKWKLEFADVNSSKCDVPAAPTFVAQFCTGPGTTNTASYTIPSDSGIKYQVRINGGSWQDLSAGTVNVTVFPRLIEVQALADGSIIVPGSTTYWSYNFTTAGDCLVNAFPVEPDWTDSVCQSTTTGSTQATYEVFATANVTYQVSTNGVDYAPIGTGVHNATVGTTVWIKALPASGYQLVGDAGPWSHLFVSPGDCLDPAYPAAAVFTDSVCEADTTGATQGTYEVIAASHVTYEISADGGTTWDPVSVGVHNANPGDSVIIRAVPDTGYELENYTGPWSHTFADPGNCLDEAFPGDPKFVDSICEANTTGSTQATYEIVAATNVSYEISFNGVDYTTVGASVGVHNATPGTKIWIKAIADPGYEILGQSVWEHEFADPGDCLDDAPVDPVIAVDQVCVLDDPQTLAAHLESGTITIPTTAHVTYYVDGVEKAAGVHDYAPGTYPISAVADSGYQLTGVPDPWTVTIEPAVICGQLPDLPLVDPVVTFVQTTCSASGSYTLGAEPIENAAGIIWTVSGGLPTTLGTHSVTTAGTVNITATADGPDYGFPGDADGIIEWSYDFASLPDDCLPTLALTGGSIAAGGLGLSALLTLGGILFVTSRRRDMTMLEG
jgi:hypothetical protein